MAKKQNSLILFIGGQKGGVGKSFTTRCLIEYFWNQGWSYQLIEADEDNPDVATIYDKGELPKIYTKVAKKGLEDTVFNLSPCQYIGFSDSKYRINEPDIIFDSALEATTIVNLPSNVEEQLNNWLKKSDILGLKETYNVDIFKMFVTDGCYSSIQLLYKSLEDYGKEMHHILVKNLGRITGGATFDYLYKDEKLKSELKEFSVEEVELPMLFPEEQYFLDKNQLTFREGEELAKEELGVVSAQRLVNYRREVFTALSKISFLQTNSKSKSSTNKAA